MPFGRGKKDEPDRTREAAPDVPSAVGDQPCSEPGCRQHDGVPCGYVDRRGQRCDSAWCADHRSLFDGRVFCRRHIGTLRAIGVDIVDRALAPEIGNRAPSLVRWVCDDLDLRIRELMLSLIEPGSHEEFGEERVRMVQGIEGTRRWERSWKLFDNRGASAKVTVSVEEAYNTWVTVRGLGGQPIAQVVPPWIERRINNTPVSAEQDEEERQAFYDMLFTKIRATIISGRGDGHASG